MTLPLTPATLEAAYEYLRTTPPFAAWSLPEGDEVKFKVGKFRGKFAAYQWDGKQHTITISGASVSHTGTLLEALGHEMIHLHLEDTGNESRGNENVHNIWFRRFAAEVCKVHGWDVKAFY